MDAAGGAFVTELRHTHSPAANLAPKKATKANGQIQIASAVGNPRGLP